MCGVARLSGPFGRYRGQGAQGQVSGRGRHSARRLPGRSMRQDRQHTLLVDAYATVEWLEHSRFRVVSGVVGHWHMLYDYRLRAGPGMRSH